MATPGRGAVRAPPQAALGRSPARPVRRRWPFRECSDWAARSRGIRESASGAPGCASDPWAGRAPGLEAPAWGEATSCPPRTTVPTRPALTPAARGPSCWEGACPRGPLTCCLRACRAVPCAPPTWLPARPSCCPPYQGGHLDRLCQDWHQPRSSWPWPGPEPVLRLLCSTDPFGPTVADLSPRSPPA